MFACFMMQQQACFPWQLSSFCRQGFTSYPKCFPKEEHPKDLGSACYSPLTHKDGLLFMALEMLIAELFCVSPLLQISILFRESCHPCTEKGGTYHGKKLCFFISYPEQRVMWSRGSLTKYEAQSGNMCFVGVGLMDQRLRTAHSFHWGLMVLEWSDSS